MPARVIRSEINSSDSLSRVSLEADLTFRALIVAVDDYGRMDARPHILKAELFPLRDELSPARVAELVAELAAIPNAPVALYEAEGRPYLQLTGWDRWRGNSRRANKSRFPEPPGDSRSVPEMRGNPPVNRESGVGSRESRSESREAATGGRSRARGEDQDRGQDHALTDANRTDLDANPHTTPPEPAPAPHRPLPQPDHAALTAAREVLDHWRDLRAADVPTDRAAQPDAWPLRRDPLAMRLAPRVRERGKAALIEALDHGWRDRGDGKRWPGWRAKLSTPERAFTALTESELVDQARDAKSAHAEAAKREREGGNGRRPSGPEPPDYAAITRDREAYEKRVREEYEQAERADRSSRRGGDPVPIGAALSGALKGVMRR